MVHKTNIIPGLSRFIDEAILAQYPPTSMKRILAAGGVSLYLKHNEGVVDSLLSNPLIASLGVVTPDGMVNIETLRDVYRAEISKAGYMRISFPIIGDIDFTPDDIDTLYKYIVNTNTPQVSSSLPTPTTVPHNGGIY
jgi:hypothetical protein